MPGENLGNMYFTIMAKLDAAKNEVNRFVTESQQRLSALKVNPTVQSDAQGRINIRDIANWSADARAQIMKRFGITSPGAASTTKAASSSNAAEAEKDSKFRAKLMLGNYALQEKQEANALRMRQQSAAVHQTVFAKEQAEYVSFWKERRNMESQENKEKEANSKYRARLMTGTYNHEEREVKRASVMQRYTERQNAKLAAENAENLSKNKKKEEASSASEFARLAKGDAGEEKESKRASDWRTRLQLRSADMESKREAREQKQADRDRKKAEKEAKSSDDEEEGRGRSKHLGWAGRGLKGLEGIRYSTLGLAVAGIAIGASTLSSIKSVNQNNNLRTGTAREREMEQKLESSRIAGNAVREIPIVGDMIANLGENIAHIGDAGPKQREYELHLEQQRESQLRLSRDQDTDRMLSFHEAVKDTRKDPWQKQNDEITIEAARMSLKRDHEHESRLSAGFNPTWSENLRNRDKKLDDQVLDVHRDAMKRDRNFFTQDLNDSSSAIRYRSRGEGLRANMAEMQLAQQQELRTTPAELQNTVMARQKMESDIALNQVMMNERGQRYGLEHEGRALEATSKGDFLAARKERIKADTDAALMNVDRDVLSGNLGEDAGFELKKKIWANQGARTANEDREFRRGFAHDDELSFNRQQFYKDELNKDPMLRGVSRVSMLNKDMADYETNRNYVRTGGGDTFDRSARLTADREQLLKIQVLQRDTMNQYVNGGRAEQFDPLLMSTVANKDAVWEDIKEFNKKASEDIEAIKANIEKLGGII